MFSVGVGWRVIDGGKDLDVNDGVLGVLLIDCDRLVEWFGVWFWRFCLRFGRFM